jgi:type II secretory pathway component PulJ
MRNRARNQRTHRRAFALVEAVGVITLVTAILSLSAVTLNQAFIAHRTALAHFRLNQQLQRFGDQIRRDVHLASEVVVEDDSRLILRMDLSKQITYEFDSTSAILTRIVARSGEVTARETWSVPNMERVEWKLDTQQRRALISTRLVYAASANQPLLEWLAVGKGVDHGESSTAE